MNFEKIFKANTVSLMVYFIHHQNNNHLQTDSRNVQKMWSIRSTRNGIHFTTHILRYEEGMKQLDIRQPRASFASWFKTVFPKIHMSIVLKNKMLWSIPLSITRESKHIMKLYSSCEETSSITMKSPGKFKMEMEGREKHLAAHNRQPELKLCLHP